MLEQGRNCDIYNPTIHNWEKGHGHKVVLGNYVSIAEGVEFFLSGNHRTDFVSTFHFLKFVRTLDPKELTVGKGDIIVKSDAWIGRGAVIQGGVTIGEGAVIGTNAMVTKDVEPYSITAGNPSRHKKYRFNESQRKSLLEIAWWNWPDEKVIEEVKHLANPDIDLFISRHRKSG